MTGVCFTLVTILLFDLFGGCYGLAVSQHTFLSPPHLPLEVPVKPRAVSQDVLGGVRTKEILSLQRQCQLDFVRGFGFVNFDGGIWWKHVKTMVKSNYFTSSDPHHGISSHIFWHLCRWGPAVLTQIRRSQLRSGRAHWDPELAVEVRQYQLRPGTCSWDPRLPEEKEEKAALRKSRDPCLAGEENKHPHSSVISA